MATDIAIIDRKKIEDVEIKVGKRYLVRQKPYLTKDDEYHGWNILGVASIDFAIVILEESNNKFNIKSSLGEYWIEKNKIFNWSDRKRKAGWVVVEELKN